MNYFLVDYENVNIAGLDGITKLTEEDFIIIFYSDNANTLTFGMHRKINETKAEIKFQKVAVNEKNALDFQLCSYLGFLIRDTMTEETSKNNYFIVSNDNGYSVLPSYWKKLGVTVKIVSNLKKDEAQNISADKVFEKSNTVSEKNSELEKVLSKFFVHNTDIQATITIINDSKAKTDVHNNLVKKFGEKGKNIYQSVKSFIGDKK